MNAHQDLRINGTRLLRRLEDLAEIGRIGGGGVCRLALTDEDKAGRDLVVVWMKELDLEVSIDPIGNIIGIRRGVLDGPPVMAGSHLDTVATGGRYDGSLGVLAALEVVESLNDAGISTRHPLAVGVFTNEEGARFQPDMMGSMVHQGALDLDSILEVEGIDGASVGEELARIGYAGDAPCGSHRPRAYVEVHVEQGPVLEREGIRIGAVEGVQGISWKEVVIHGISNHAGTTPMDLRCDAAFAAARVTTFARTLARGIGGGQVATVGRLELSPNLINVIPNRALLTLDLRNMSEALLRQAEARLLECLDELHEEEGVRVDQRSLARFLPVAFDREVIGIIEAQARGLGASVLRLPSGAGHDAQSFAPNCPSGMIFVPSVGGISHNVEEYTTPEDLVLGADVLLHTLLTLALR